ncbi:T9SS type A sorting domain-containing protein [Flavobacterium longum]|uniref:T9SS type A sorting domain-containing protein n=1 Tax=Flavobacterium longum TaxID=1299340 RepID=UPI0039E8A130
MKKILLSILALFAFCRGEAQFFEGFEGTTLANQVTGQWTLSSGNWLVFDNGVGLNQQWTTISAVTFPPTVYEGTNAAYINRENIGPDNIGQDWLVTPAVTVGPDYVLTFYTRTTIFGDQGTDYQILVSTTSQSDQSSFVPIVLWNESDLTAAYNIYEQKAVSLSAYAGQSIYIAFMRRFQQFDAPLSGDRWLVDNVSVAEGSPGENQSVNTINGTVSYNADGNGCDNDGVNAITIAADNGAYTFYKQAYDGTYSMTVLGNNFTVSPHNYPSIFSPMPLSHTINFPGSGSSATADFCFVPSGDLIYDVSVEIIRLGSPPRPGFDCAYKIIVTNHGHLPESGTVNFSFDESILDVISASMSGNITAGNVSWDFTDLYTFQRREYVVILNLNSPVETPAVNIGQQIEFIASASIPVDDVIANNIAALKETVVGSYDPNDKSVNEGATITPDQIDDFLHYVIRFQNTGNASAEFVRITDDLSNNLDLTTLEIVSWSHDVRLSLQGYRAEFLFANINLPPTSEDEPGSQGYVAYKIKPVGGLELGDSISNTAKIYFDYNFPIITNTVTTTVTALGVGETVTDNFSLYPNPVKNSLTISMLNNAAVSRISIYNMLGQLVESITPAFENGSMSVDTDALNTGTYFMQFVTNNGATTKKIMKL